MTACTVTSAVSGRCGRPAVVTFRSVLTGETFAECERHAVLLRRPLDPVRIERRDIRLGKHRDGTPRTKRHYVAVNAHTGDVVSDDSFRNALERRMAAGGRRLVK